MQTPQQDGDRSGDARQVHPKRMRGHPRKGEERPNEPTWLKRQCTMDLEEMVDELPKEFTTGVKRNA
ncbi:MAG: hypothetical protein OXI38_06280 [Bacteroidota bacterium]|nr:hypothetical protein [Bacteroidota bacterium]